MRSSPDAIVLMTVSEAFLIFVDDILSLYLLASPYSSTGIEQLLQICIYMLNRPCEAARQIGDGVLYLWMIPNKNFCKFTFFHADTETYHKILIQ